MFSWLCVVVVFCSVPHFLGYEGRCGLPSNFDCNYCYTLGSAAAALIQFGYTGMMATASNLTAAPSDWTVGGVPLTHLMNMERRTGHDKPVIRKALVELDAAPFQLFQHLRYNTNTQHAANSRPISFSLCPFVVCMCVVMLCFVVLSVFVLLLLFLWCFLVVVSILYLFVILLVRAGNYLIRIVIQGQFNIVINMVCTTIRHVQHSTATTKQKHTNHVKHEREHEQLKQKQTTKK